jgi:hypothetical protein
MRSNRRRLGHVTNEEVKSRIRQAIGPYEELITTIKRRKLKWFGHVTRGEVSKTVLREQSEEAETGVDRRKDGKITSLSEST